MMLVVSAVLDRGDATYSSAATFRHEECPIGVLVEWVLRTQGITDDPSQWGNPSRGTPVDAGLTHTPGDVHEVSGPAPSIDLTNRERHSLGSVDRDAGP